MVESIHLYNLYIVVCYWFKFLTVKSKHLHICSNVRPPSVHSTVWLQFLYASETMAVQMVLLCTCLGYIHVHIGARQNVNICRMNWTRTSERICRHHSVVKKGVIYGVYGVVWDLRSILRMFYTEMNINLDWKRTASAPRKVTRLLVLDCSCNQKRRTRKKAYYRFLDI